MFDNERPSVNVINVIRRAVGPRGGWPQRSTSTMYIVNSTYLLLNYRLFYGVKFVCFADRGREDKRVQVPNCRAVAVNEGVPLLFCSCV